MQIRVDLGLVAKRRLGVDVAVDRDPAAPSETVDFMLPVWTPGSYLVRDYSRHLRDVVALDGTSGLRLPVEKTRKNRYRVTCPTGCARVLLRYQVYAHSLTVRESWVGDEFAFWNGACVYLWPMHATAEPATIRVDMPEAWELYCGAEVECSGNRRHPIAEFQVAGLEQAVDTPCLAMTGARVIAFEALGVHHRFVCAGLGPIEPPAERLVEDTRKVIEQAAAVFGCDELPFSHYTFLSLFSAAGRGGLEHCNSSTILAPRMTFGSRTKYREFVGLVAHEYFHVWNVKRLRPREFHDFDFERENYSCLLWVAEGFTAYYDEHLCLRAGIVDAATYLQTLAQHIDNTRRMPGRFAQTLEEASFDAWIRFYRQDENTRNITQNYYSNGALAAICIDARIREASAGERSLDDVMVRLFADKGEQGYGFDDVVNAASVAAGQDLGEHIESLVRESFDPDFDAVFATYGLVLVDKQVEAPRLGLQFNSGTLRVAVVLDDTPAWNAGMAPGDEILAVQGVRVRSQHWSELLVELVRDSSLDRVTLCIDREGLLQDVEVEILAADRGLPGGVKIVADADADEGCLARRRAWLGESADELPVDSE